ncbi:hypothetical protein [Tahibacter amnicola]|uniref:WD40 repeat protein n=1 Tax=Tahibacter amnicola TaxID=2976241 RepID=A0ABY6BB40_9GAMM|nr:hypothetical protein [Tahibacter amnicola]UXI67022.1 hypothetical protein N4264_20050 [Tahibacter amnicola]
MKKSMLARCLAATLALASSITAGAAGTEGQTSRAPERESTLWRFGAEKNVATSAVPGDAVFGNAFMTLRTEGNHGAAITALWVRNTQYIDQDGRGRLMQMAVFLGGNGECVNPTEAGSDLPKDIGTQSTLLFAQLDGSTFRSAVHPAYWYFDPDLTPDPPANPPPPCPVDVPPSRVSQDLMEKTVEIGVEGDDRLGRHVGRYTMQEEIFERYYAEMPTTYLNQNFWKLTRFDPVTRESRVYPAFDSEHDPGGPASESNVPAILSTCDGKHAYGMWSPFEAEGGDFAYRVHMFDFSEHGWSNSAKLSVTRGWGSGGPNPLEVTTYFTAGTIDEVKASLARIYSMYPTDVPRQWPPTGVIPPGTEPTVSCDILGIPTGTAIDLRAFDITSADISTGNKARLSALSNNGTVLNQKWQIDTRWGEWTSDRVTDLLGLPSIRSFSHGPDPAGIPTEWALDSTGTALFSRKYTASTYSWSTWKATTVSGLGISGVHTIRSFDHEGPDAALGARHRQTVVSNDGRTIYFRITTNNVWGPWHSVLVSAQGIPGLTAVRSFSMGVTPSGLVRQDMLSNDGRLVYFRVYHGTAWGPWNTTVVADLKVPDYL